jgi:5-(carboxyamino)imidazole ribonucleotide synthase
MTDRRTGMPVVGMIGAGQLARMTHQAAIGLGLSLRLLAAEISDGAALVAADVEVGDYRDEAVLAAFAKGCDVVTFDHEHVPGERIRALQGAGVAVRPSAEALRYAQDKVAMRKALAELGLPVPPYAAVEGADEVTAFGDAHGWPVVVKAVSGGYDGRGVWVLGRGDPLPPVEHLYVEQRAPLLRELAVQVARRPSGQMQAWPVVETVQSEGICVEVLAPAPGLAAERAGEARRIAETIAERLDVVGVLAVELFDTETGLLVNELAMRPHNSGHVSIEGAATSQFEQHLRAVLDWPLGATSPTAPYAVMANLLGGEQTDLPRALPVALAADSGVRVHLYGKSVRAGRKIGHVTALGDDLEATRERARRAVATLRGPVDG